MEIAIVDLQGFIHNDVFVIKEICILTKNNRIHEIVKSPYPLTSLSAKYKQQVKWLENHYHGLKWNQGYITQKDLYNTITPILNNKFIIVKGLNKIKWMREILSQQINIYINAEDMGCNIRLSKPFSKQETENIQCCKNHKFENNNCALQNALLIKQWYSHDNAIDDE